MLKNNDWTQFLVPQNYINNESFSRNYKGLNEHFLEKTIGAFDKDKPYLWSGAIELLEIKTMNALDTSKP